MNTERLASHIRLATLLGTAVDWGYHEYAKDAAATKDIALYFSIVTDIFLHTIKMIIAPSIFSTLMTGLASMSDGCPVGCVGLRVMAWFVCMSATPLALGTPLVNFFQPGMHMNLALPDVSATSGLKTGDFTLKAFITHMFPRSVVEAMATSEILQVLVFSLFFNAVLPMMENPMDSVIGCDPGELTRLIFRIIDYVICSAPLGVLTAMAAVITMEGVGVLWTYGKLIGELYLGLALLWAILFLVGYVLLNRLPGRLLGLTHKPTLPAFTIANGESIYPKVIEALDWFGVPKRISGFVLPLGRLFNLDGSMMYQALAVLFIVQTHSIEISFTQQVTLLLVLMFTSKGMAGMACTSLVVVTATLPMLYLPEAGLLLIIGTNQFFDMGRTTTNVIGSSLVTAVMAKCGPAEGEATVDVAEPVMQPTVG